jgi:hypothetical protein
MSNKYKTGLYSFLKSKIFKSIKAAAVLLLLVSFNLRAQEVLPASKFNEYKLSNTVLDSIYKPALHSDSLKAVFFKHDEQFTDAWTKMLQDLGDYLTMNNFKWDKPTWCFTKVYFNKKGGVDYFIYNFKEDATPLFKQREFDRHLKDFLKGYKFKSKYKPGIPFYQSGPVTFIDQHLKP